MQIKKLENIQNFIDAVRSRKNPIAPVEVGCSTNTLCCIANIATNCNVLLGGTRQP